MVPFVLFVVVCDRCRLFRPVWDAVLW